MESTFNIPVQRKTSISLTVPRAIFQVQENGCTFEMLAAKLAGAADCADADDYLQTDNDFSSDAYRTGLSCLNAS